MSWHPSGESLSQLAACLKDSLSGFDKHAQKQADLAKKSPDINNYLAYLLSSPSPPDGLHCSEEDYHLVRSAAGIMLKNNVRTDWKSIPEASLQLVKMAVPLSLQDKNAQIRNFAGNIATEVIRRGGLLGWPDLLPQLLDMIANPAGRFSSEAQEGAMSAMAKICEDNSRMLTKEVNGQRPLNYVLPQLIAATKSPLAKVRAGALTAINIFTPRESQAMLNSIDQLLQHLFVLAGDDSTEVRRQVCRAFVQLVESRPDKLQPHIAGLVDYIIAQQKGGDEDLACEAAEFWLAVGEHDNLWNSLQPYLDKIIPVLLQCMVYSSDDIALLGGLEDDEDEDDRQEDIKPAFAKKSHARTANGGGGGEGAGSSAENGGGGGGGDRSLEEGEVVGDGRDGGHDRHHHDGDEEDNDDDDGGDDDDGDDDDGDESPDERWTVRKCSAAALDVFARDFGGPVFEAIFPYLSQNLKHTEWPYREAAVLALGAVADGCMETVTPHLPELVPYLISLLEDGEPVVRQITCWALGRYSSWAANLADAAHRERFFVPMLDGILRKMLDRNKKVQGAGASAFANLEEKAGKKLEPYCGPIMQQLVRCFDRYKDRNMYILYDCVQTLAERLGPFIAKPELANQLMPALIGRYRAIPDEGRELFPLLECLSFVALALGEEFTPYAGPIFGRCVGIIHAKLEQTMAAASGQGGVEEPDKDFLVTSLDLLSAIVQALGPDKAGELVGSSPQPLFELLSYCMEDGADEVRQSAYALLGDCARFVFPQLRSYVPRLLPVLLAQLDVDSMADEAVEGAYGVVNNACWSAGEIALQQRDEGGLALAPWVAELLGRLVDIMGNPNVPRGLVENAAIAVGRLGLGAPERLAAALPEFAGDFLTAMQEVEATEEKASALRGFTMVVARNPAAIEKQLAAFFVTIARYEDLDLRSPMKQELHEGFQGVLNTYKQMMPQFDDFVGRLPPQDQQSLKSNYGV